MKENLYQVIKGSGDPEFMSAQGRNPEVGNMPPRRRVRRGQANVGEQILLRNPEIRTAVRREVRQQLETLAQADPPPQPRLSQGERKGGRGGGNLVLGPQGRILLHSAGASEPTAAGKYWRLLTRQRWDPPGEYNLAEWEDV